MAKKYDHNRPCAYRSYKIRDICWLYADQKLHKDTLLIWINTGELPAFKHGNLYYVYGAVLKDFLKKRRDQNKRSFAFDEFKCWTGGHVCRPKNNKINKLSRGNNKILIAFADCPVCGMQMRRTYSINSLPEIMEFFTIEQNDVLELCDSATSLGKTDIDNNNKMLLSKIENKNSSTTLNETNTNNKNNSTKLSKTCNKSEQLNLFNIPEET